MHGFPEHFLCGIFIAHLKCREAHMSTPKVSIFMENFHPICCAGLGRWLSAKRDKSKFSIRVIRRPIYSFHFSICTIFFIPFAYVSRAHLPRESSQITTASGAAHAQTRKLFIESFISTQGEDKFWCFIPFAKSFARCGNSLWLRWKIMLTPDDASQHHSTNGKVLLEMCFEFIYAASNGAFFSGE